VSSYTATSRIAPWFTFGADRSLRLVYRNLRAARRFWIIVVSGFFEPLFYLLGLGVGVGTLVGDFTYAGETISYQEFVAPALLAASAMNGAIYETTGNVFFKLNYAKTYEGVLATPLGVRDVAVGETIYALMRGTLYAVAFVVVMLALGLLESAWAILAVPAALLIGAAFAAIGLSAVTLMRSWADFAFIELLTLPMFLFSATFVPLDEYPAVAQWIVPLTPLYHGVHMLRSFTLGDVGWTVLLDIAYLLAMTGIFLVLADRRLARLLLK
jgi:lipooligosaccharide transport system permease protein